LRNGNTINGIERIKAIAYLKERIRDSIRRSSIISEFGMTMLGIPILKLLLTIPFSKVTRVLFVNSIYPLV